MVLLFPLIFSILINSNDFERLADAIYLAEGAERARQPYGIETIECRTEKACRRVCLKTIKNNFNRWQKARKPGDFLAFLSKRYCPKNNEVWLKNVKFFYGKKQRT